jgi:hypothetical protein
VARQAARLIAAALLAGFAAAAGAPPNPDRLKTPQTPFYMLSPDERRVLAPVQESWTHLPGYQQQRLINSARRYPSMQPIQKERFDARIKNWAEMTPEQRRAARETFEGLRRLPPARQHELRERWFQRHRQAEELSEPGFGERKQGLRSSERQSRQSGEKPAQRR